MGKRTGWTIAVRVPDGSLRKLTKIIDLNGKGFSVFVPYHKASSGFLCKLPIDPKGESSRQKWPETQAFTADDKVKLSYHSDGFAQFSGVVGGKIISGIDEATGMPKGLGLFTNPLSNPIWTGGTVGITAWGLEDFEVASPDDDLVVFEPDDFYLRTVEPPEGFALVLQIYALPARVQPPLRMRNGRLVVDIAAQTINGRLEAVVEMRVLPLPTELVMLAAFVNRVPQQMVAPSGWIINGPGDHSPGRRGHVLLALYPRDGINIATKESLNRSQNANPEIQAPGTPLAKNDSEASPKPESDSETPNSSA